MVWHGTNHGIHSILIGFLLVSLVFSWILHFLSKGEMKSSCFSWCKSKISCCSKSDSGEKTGLNESTEQNTNYVIEQIEPAEESRCNYKCFNWFKCNKMCQTEISRDDCISLRFVHKQSCPNFSFFTTFSALHYC